MNTARVQRIALTTCDNVFEAGGVANSVVRIARGLSTYFNVQVDIIILDPDGGSEFNPLGKNGITQLDERFSAPIRPANADVLDKSALYIASSCAQAGRKEDAVTIFRLGPWTGGTSAAQHWVDIHYALL